MVNVLQFFFCPQEVNSGICTEFGLTRSQLHSEFTFAFASCSP